MAIKNRSRLGTSLTHEHFNFLTDLCYENRQKQSVIIEIALDLLKEELKNRDNNLYNIMKYLKSIK